MKKTNLKNHVYKLIELTGTSPVSIEKAIEGAIKRYGSALHLSNWAWQR